MERERSMRRTIIITGLIICSVIIVSCYLNSVANQPKETKLEMYWPTINWKAASPEGLGLDSSRLQSMVNKIRNDMPTIDSFLVIRHGYIAAEEYYGSYNETSKHHIYSCTKSVMSTLIGIAIDDGKIPSVDSKVLDLIPSHRPNTTSPWKEEITLENLLTMTSGIDARDDYPDNWLWLDRMLASEDAVQYCLDLNVTVKPGTVFKYTNANSHLLSAVLEESTGRTTLEYAKEKLFTPLGIYDVTWKNDISGRMWGFYGLYLRPRDMAKIGYIFLHDGEWDGDQIVPISWVREAASKKTDADLFPGYGYHWWTGNNFYCAMGYAGQFIYIFPEQDLIIVFTGHGQENWGNPQTLVRDYVLPAIKG